MTASQQGLLKEAEYLLKDIKTELHGLAPHSSKLAEISHLLKWLINGEEEASLQAFGESLPTLSDTDDLFGSSDQLFGIDEQPDARKRWFSPLQQVKDNPELCENILLNLASAQSQTLDYRPLYGEAAKPFFYIVDKTFAPNLVSNSALLNTVLAKKPLAAFVLLFCHHLRDSEQLDWHQIQPNTLKQLMLDVFIPVLAEHSHTAISDVIVKDETHRQTTVALDDILKHRSDPNVGIWLNGQKLTIKPDYLPPIDAWIVDALQLQLENERPLLFFETLSEYVLFGS
ncbi:hypothetical protein M0C34_09775 [Agarivorans sp. TSD2052]|uniref:hypothetical protein n=1 Tax=Agarivorans sp. TSD2052 TaxID=2937286 RepID=UPI00200DE026|nr:hypothetical protein [Agarivorans sp. TSD2052]UPW20518.1 hypothetical protein M0C34_09775 [Agarivorans sp. TSD2052]